jgi:hypothetical protein
MRTLLDRMREFGTIDDDVAHLGVASFIGYGPAPRSS